MAKMTPEGQNFVSDEISHLIKDGPSKGPQKGKKMPQKQAIAVALDVARRKGFKSSKNPNEGVSIFDKIVNEAMPPSTMRDRSPSHWAGSQNVAGRKRELQGHLAAIAGTKQGITDTFESRQYRLKDRKDGAMSIFDGILKQELTKSLFDDIVDTGAKSLFDGIVDTGAKSLFDGIVESTEEVTSLFDEFTSDKPAKAGVDWNDRVARTMILAEELIELRSSAK